MSISAANGIENCKLCVVFIFIDTKKKLSRGLENLTIDYMSFIWRRLVICIMCAFPCLSLSLLVLCNIW